MERMDFPVGRWGRFCEMDPDPLALERAKIDTYNREVGDMKDWDCPECRNKGYIAFLDGDRMRYRDCRCKVKRRCIRRMKESGLQDVIRKYTFDSFRAVDPWQKAMLETARRYAADPQGWLCMAGQSGSGKTHLCTAVCRELLFRDMELIYMPWKEDTRKLKDQGLDSTERVKLMNQLKKAEILYIDDLLWHSRGDSHAAPSAADVTLAFELLNSRNCSGLRTIISTELTLPEISRISEAVAGRIIDNAQNRICTITADQRKNYRLRSVSHG